MRLLTTIVLIYAIVMPVQAEQTKVRSWGELSQDIQPEWTLRMVLPDSTLIEGKQAAFTPEALTLKVVKTSNAAQHPKGQITIPREQVKTLDIRKNGVKYRTIGTLAPIAAGAGVGAAVTRGQQDILAAAAGAAVFLIIAVVGGTAGFFIGRAADRAFHTVAVKP
jgi:hypothetical protein